MEKVDIFDQEVGVAVSKVGEPCKYKSTGNSFSFVARSVSRSEALSEY